jgi:uncharacterized sporulation protein YeaH/YhbH (DUF444 family)
MVNIIDRRFTQKNESVEDRKRFIKRYKNHIKRAIRGAVAGESIKDFKFKDKKIKIKVEDMEDSLDIPSPTNNPDAGIYDYLHIGNEKYKKGNRVPRPKGILGRGKRGSKDGGGKDEFEFTLTEKEFSDLFFEDLELPDMVKKRFTGDSYEIRRCGYSNTGGPSSLNIKQTILRAFMRRYALKKKRDKDAEKELEGFILKNRKKIHFLEDVDLRYNYRDRVDIPSTKAVMFLLMDVSGSMGEREKDIAKRFFILMNMFLNRNYTTVDVVFVRHAEWADECDEQTFFYGQESGGTVISAGLEKIKEIINARYKPELWNIYIAQASDGDNWGQDNNLVMDLLTKTLLPITQYYSYIEIIPEDENEGGEVYDLFKEISGGFKNLHARLITDYKDIFEAFRSLFKKDKSK